MHIAEEADDMLQLGEEGQIAENYHSVEAVVYNDHQAAKDLDKVPSVASCCSCLSNKIIGETARGNQISNMFGQI